MRLNLFQASGTLRKAAWAARSNYPGLLHLVLAHKVAVSKARFICIFPGEEQSHIVIEPLNGRV